VFKTRLEIILKIFRFFGFRHRCNNCGIYLKRFLSLTEILPQAQYDILLQGKIYKATNFETFNEQHYFCPICMIPDKGRLIIAFLESLKLPDGLSILHLTPETGIQKKLDKLFAKHNYVSSIFGDYRTLNVDIEKEISLNFDIIICSHILEHVKNDKLALKNLYNALNPRGIALFLTPLSREIDFTFEDLTIISPIERKKAYGEEDHVRQYGRKDFQELVKSVFDDLKIFEVLHLNYLRLGLAKDSKLYIGMKS
jgi:hypothetical protein